MEITLKNIVVNERLSEESTCFTATVYINGIRAGKASNTGYGGNTEYSGFDARGTKLLMEAAEFCLRLPPKVCEGANDGKDVFVGMDLDLYVDDLVTEFRNGKALAKFRGKLKRFMNSAIVVGVPDKEFRGWNVRVPFKYIFKSEKGTENLRKFIEDGIVPKMKDGEFILNTNLPVDFVDSLPVARTRFVEQAREIIKVVETPEKQQNFGKDRMRSQ